MAFHVGSDARDLKQFKDAFEDSRLLFDMARLDGIEMNVLDIGGGYPGNDNHFFAEIAKVINSKIEKHFNTNVEIIAEPGMFEPFYAISIAFISEHFSIKLDKVDF